MLANHRDRRMYVTPGDWVPFLRHGAARAASVREGRIADLRLQRMVSFASGCRQTMHPTRLERVTYSSVVLSCGVPS